MSDHPERDDTTSTPPPATSWRDAFKAARQQRAEHDALDLQGDVRSLSEGEFVERFAPFVNGICWNLLRANQLSAAWMEDARAYAYTGLLEARQRFNPVGAATFTTFAFHRVRGATLDGLARSGALPRRAVASLRAQRALASMREEQALADAEQPQEAPPVEAFLSAAATAWLLRVEAEAEAEVQVERQRPGASLEARQSAALLRRAVEELPELERAIIQAVDLEQRAPIQVAAELGLSRSWLCRLRGRALEQLRQRLDPDDL